MTRLPSETLARLLLLASLALPALAFQPHAQHAFWSAELLSLRWLAPLAFLAALAAPAAQGAPQTGLKKGLKLLMALISLWLLSAAFARRPDLSLSELSQWLAYPMLFFAAWRLGRTRQEQSKLLFLILMTGVLQALYAMLQAAGKDPFPWAMLFGGRPGGFLGNPNFLGGHLALLLPLSLAHAASKQRWHWLLPALLLTGLIATQTRGAWAGAALGCAITLMMLRRSGGPGLLKRSGSKLAALGVLALVAGGAFVLSSPGALKRLGGDEELSRRGVLMQAAGKMALQHPLLGVGPGHYRLHFPTVQAVGLTPETYAKRGYVYSEHAHNDFVQMAADAGIPAMLVYIFLLLWLFKGLWKGSSLLSAGILGGLAALQVHGLANFPFLLGPTQATAWALAALGLRSLTYGQSEEGASKSYKGLVALGLLVFAWGAWAAGRLFAQDMLWWVGEGEIKLGNHGAGRRVVEKALSLNGREDRLWRQLGMAQAGSGELAGALKSYKRALELNPNYVEARWELGKLYLRLHLPADAEAELAKAAACAPNLAELWEPLGEAFFMQKKFKQAVMAYDWALYFKVDPARILGNKAAALGNLGEKSEALKSVEEALLLEPGNSQLQGLRKALR